MLSRHPASAMHRLWFLLITLSLIVGCGTAGPSTTSLPATAAQVAAAATPTPLPPSATSAPPPATATAHGATETQEPTTTAPLPPTEPPVSPTATTAAPSATSAPSAQGFLLEGVGFETPESVLYDAEADVYLVANIHGAPSAKDGNGFISRISPEGDVIALKWIAGAAEGGAGFALNAPKGMALTADRLFVADIDVVRVFDRRTGGWLEDVPIEGAGFLNDVAAGEGRTVYVTDSATGLVHRIRPDSDVEVAGQIESPNGIQVDGETILVTGGSNQIYRLGEDGSFTPVYETPAGGLDGLIVLSDGSVLVSSWVGSAVYRIDTEGQVTELLSGFRAPADIGFDARRNVVLIPQFEDDRLVVTPLPSAGAPQPTGPHAPVLAPISVDTAGQLEPLVTLSGHTGRVCTLAFSADGAYLASASQDRSVRLWDLQRKQEVHAFAITEVVMDDLAFSPDGQLLASAETIWDVASGQAVQALHRGGFGTVAFSPDGMLLAVAMADQPIELWDVSRWQAVRVLDRQAGDVTLSIDFSPDGTRLAASGHLDGRIWLWDVGRGQVERMLTHNTESNIHIVVFSPDGRLLASASTDATVKLWEVSTGQLVHSLRHGAGLYGAAFSPDGSLVASAGVDRAVKLWETASGQRVSSLSHDDEVMAVAFSPGGSLLATGGYDRQIVLWGVPH